MPEKELKELETLAKERMQTIANYVENSLPDGFGFMVFAYAHNQKGLMLYVSNSQREQVVEAMKEFIAQDEKNYGKDVPNE